MSLFGLPDDSLLFQSPQPIAHLAEVTLDCEFAGGNAENLAPIRRYDFNALARPFAEHCRTVPNIKDEESSRHQMLSRRPQRGKNLLILQLITQDCKHHQRRIKGSLHLETANIILIELSFAVDLTADGFLARALQHGCGTIDSDHFIAALRERQSMVSRSASQVQYGARGSVSIGLEKPLNELRLFAVVFIGIKRVIGIGVGRTKQLGHASTS